MLGTILNAAGIVLGGILALTFKRPLSVRAQNQLKLLLGAFTAFAGLRLTWLSLHGTMPHVLRQLCIVLLALTAGRMVGRLLGLQKVINRLGQQARLAIERTDLEQNPRFGEGFTACTLLFCAAPLAWLGATQDGLADYHLPLIIKAVMDGLATMAFVGRFGSSVIASALPVLAWQGTVALLARASAPWLAQYQVVDSINATGGLLVCCVALIILEVRKVQLADYLPSLAIAPVLTRLWG